MVKTLVHEEKMSNCHGCAIQHPRQRQHSCLVMDGEDVWMYYCDDMVERIHLILVLKTAESVCSALGMNWGSRGKPTFPNWEIIHDNIMLTNERLVILPRGVQQGVLCNNFRKLLHRKTWASRSNTLFSNSVRAIEKLAAKLGLRGATRSKPRSKGANKKFADFFQQANPHVLGRCL